jgi:hypothetical protein
MQILTDFAVSTYPSKEGWLMSSKACIFSEINTFKVKLMKRKFCLDQPIQNNLFDMDDLLFVME